MDTIPITVESYAGYKPDEYPLSFYWKNQKYEIEEILDRWYQRDITVNWLTVNYFKVRTNTNLKFIIKHDIEIDGWYLVRIF